MKRLLFVLLMLFASLTFLCQNDVDAIRYSRPGVNGTSRFKAMGGAFGALGADISCMAYNPGGLAIFKKGEVSYGGGLKFINNEGTLNGKSSGITDASFVFNNFGFAISWPSQTDKESRHILGFSNIQVQNFYEKTRLSAYTTNSIAKDMLNKAQLQPNALTLDSYSNLGYQVYVLDDTSNKFFSNVDLKRNVLQTRDIVTSGKLNDLNFTYAYSYKDQFYLGASLGLPRVNYTSTTTHTEIDDKDSMRIGITSPPGQPYTYTTTYSDPPLKNSPGRLGFNSLTYTEYFNTTGRGINLKLGAVARVNEFLRLGFYYHTSTIFTLEDKYYNSMSATFDKDTKKSLDYKDPADGGYFKYKIITPGRFGINSGFILGKKAAIGIDYEIINYKNAQLSSATVADFAGVNAVIKHKYKYASNVRAGIEFNLKPIMLRAGYNMQGSPFGNAFTGSFVRHTVSVGFGFRSKNNVFYDFVWFKNFSKEDYYMFTTVSQKSTISYNSAQFAATIGIKF
ncbi:MAG: outer membrane protein transport protein [Bacteroidetes bacterium]|nr:outer membrane protein transport protein [Bacteroidota bacterium]